MKRLIKLYALPIIGINLFISILYLILIQLDAIDPFSILGYLAVYILFPFSLLLYLVLIFILFKEKEYKVICKRNIGLIKGTTISFLIFLFLTRFEIIKPYLGYVFIYIIFPYTLLVFLGSIFLFIKKKQFKILKKSILNFLLWALILTIGIFVLNLGE